MRVTLSVTILVLSFSGSNCLLEEFLTSDDLASYAAFVNKVEANLEDNCVTNLPMVHWERKFTIMSTFNDMRKVMGEYDNVYNATTEFSLRSIFKKLDYNDVQEMKLDFELMNLIKKIDKYQTEIHNITKISDFGYYLGFERGDLIKYFQCRYKVDAKLCNGDINEMFTQFVMTIKDKIKKYASKINICDNKEISQNVLTAFFKLGMKAHIQRYILTFYEMIYSLQCVRSCVVAELGILKTQVLKDFEAYKNLMLKTMEEFAAYIKKCDAPKPAIPPSREDPKNPGGGENIQNPRNEEPPAPAAPTAAPVPKSTVPPSREDPKNPGGGENIQNPRNEEPPAPAAPTAAPVPKSTVPPSREDPKNPGGGENIQNPRNEEPPAPAAPTAAPVPKSTVPPSREDPKNPGGGENIQNPRNEEPPAPAAPTAAPVPKSTVPPSREDPKNPGGGVSIPDPSNKKPPAPAAPPAPRLKIFLIRKYPVNPYGRVNIQNPCNRKPLAPSPPFLLFCKYCVNPYGRVNIPNPCYSL
ncbi:hypothetical protein KQX54_012488 [Cotesia glomerata]|uniref:Uncharacterized protein n=1 Tax=Cotesia glomerata TaxID=32391 RepID=A0AAV7I7T1_COTGL|nr:hypothetical protein KQX54_012488 [Cotesia glomerata]